MEEANWVTELNQWIQANPNWTGILIFLFAFAESILLVGIIFPGAAFLVICTLQRVFSGGVLHFPDRRPNGGDGGIRRFHCGVRLFYRFNHGRLHGWRLYYGSYWGWF